MGNSNGLHSRYFVGHKAVANGIAEDIRGLLLPDSPRTEKWG